MKGCGQLLAGTLRASVLAATAAGMLGASAALAQEAPAAATIEQMARVLVELDPRIKTIEMRGHMVYGRAARYLFRYAAPDQYLFFMALAEDEAAYGAVGESKTIVYDSQQGRLLLVEGTVPSIQIEARGTNLHANWGFRTTRESASPPPPALRVDFPSFLRHPNVLTRQVQSLGAGKYRLTHVTESGRTIATVDSSSPFPFTGLELHASGRIVFTLQLRVNQPPPPSGFAMPQVGSLREHFEVEQTPAPEDMPGMMRIIGPMFQPLAFGAGPENQEMKKVISQAFGGTHDWPAMEARYRRDLPKLRLVLPMPR